MVTFQVKLFIDGLKDVILAPLSLVAGVLGLLRDRNDPQRHFRALMAAGRRFDDWIDLFGCAEDGRATLDDHLQKLERALAERRNQDGLTAAAQHSIDRLLESIANATTANASTAEGPTTATPRPDPDSHP